MSHDETNQPTNDDTRPRLWPDGSPMTEPAWHTGFSLCDCEHCTADDAENAEDAEPEEFQNHVGDGPSGFDYYHDTKWCC